MNRGALELEVTRSQCKRAKTIVIKRLEKDVLHEYRKLNNYARALVDTNPGSFVDIEVEKIGLDGCFLKGVVKGMLLTAIGKDPNNQMFPVAWAIVEIESESSWTWFLKCLIVDIKTQDEDEWTFMSDKQKGLLNAVEVIFPKAEHRLCARHIYANWYSVHGEQLKVAFYAVAKCARHKFKKVDNNSTEAWNFVLIRARMEDKWNGDDNFQVYFGITQHCVYLGDMTYTCGAWGHSTIPCSHATATIKSIGKYLYNYLHACYSKDKFIATYNNPIQVVRSEEFWPNSGRGELVPPLPKAMLGRPRKARMKRKYEPKKSKTKLSHHERDIYYGICKSVGHNYKTCTVDDGGKYQPKKSKTKKSATKNAPSQVSNP
ncbi:transposon protein, mutator sub-class [Tanacetum coccineum]